MFGGQIAGVENGRIFQGFTGVEVHFAPGVSNGLLATDPGISNFAYDQGCVNNVVPCSDHWSGTINGGSVSFIGVDANGNPISFAGTIMGGSFSGFFGVGGPGSPDISVGGNTQTFNFVATWTNGWTSEGTFTADSCFSEHCQGSSGTLSMATMAPTPEPGSMILAALGIFVVAFFLRGNGVTRNCRSAQLPEVSTAD